MQSLRDSGRLEDQRRTAPSPLPTATRTTPSPVVTHSGSVPQVDGRGFLACNLPWVETTRLRVTLCDVQPPVVRIIDVPADSVLPELHQLLQSAIGWTNSHLHQFMAGDVCYATATIESPEDIQDETSVPLTALGNTFEYLYDFGDGWEHIVEVLGAGGPEPGCRYGEGDCPPEDCGGPPGYASWLRRWPIRRIPTMPNCGRGSGNVPGSTRRRWTARCATPPAWHRRAYG